MHKRLLGLLASAAIIATACGGSTTSAPPVTSGDPGASVPAVSADPGTGLAAEQILNIDIGGEPASLDPNKASDSVSISVLNALHRPLVYVDKDLQVVPALAESWVISPDAKTFTFTLRDAKYSNGDQIVAADLVYGWKRLADPRIAADYGYIMGDVAGGNDVLALAGAEPPASDADIDAALEKLGVAAPDDKTFVVTLASPATYFLAAMTMWVLVPIQEKWITMEGATEAANYVSSGPFILDTWDHNSQIILKPNPNWYGDVKPTLTEINMSMITDAAARQAAYDTGEIDMNSPVSPADIERVKADPEQGAEYTETTSLDVVYYNFNNKEGPTANKNFRIALTQAVDKQALIDATYAGLGEPAHTMVMPALPGHDESINPYPFDLDAAKASMDTALQELGVGSAAELGKLKFGFNTEGTHQDRVAFLSEAWRQAFGLEFDQIGSEFPTFLDQRHLGVYTIARNGWGADYPHANNQLQGLVTCGGGNNDSQSCNEEFDTLLAQAAAEPDPAKQVDIYKQAQKILADDADRLFLSFPITASVIKPYVSGLTRVGAEGENPGDRFYETIQILEH